MTCAPTNPAALHTHAAQPVPEFAPSSDPVGEARSFLGALFGHPTLAGLCFGLWFMPGKRSEWFQNLDEMARRAVESSAGADVYCRMTPVRTPPTGGGRGSAECAAALVSLWGDIDIAGEGHDGKKNYPRDMDEAMGIVRAVPALPSLVVHSGGGIHPHWILEEPCLFKSDDHRQRANHAVRSLGGTLQRRAAERGRAVDSVYELARVLRVPGTLNRKLADRPRPVVILDRSGPLHVFEDLHATISGIGGEISISALGRREAQPASATDMDDDELLRRACEASNGDRFERLFRYGDTSLHQGDSSAADLALCNGLAFWTKKDAGRMDRIFRRSALLRPKWDERHSVDGRTYGEMTIDRAIAGCSETYRGSLPSSGSVPSADSRGSIVRLGQHDPASRRLVLSRHGCGSCGACGASYPYPIQSGGRPMAAVMLSPTPPPPPAPRSLPSRKQSSPPPSLAEQSDLQSSPGLGARGEVSRWRA